jgi:hypothetical protein
MKASYLKQVIGYFDPMQSLDEKHKGWYVERPDSPEEAIKIYLINNSTDTKILFSGHRGSGKTSTLSKLACDAEIQKTFLVVKFSIKDELNVADLTYTDLLLAIGHRLYEAGESWLDSKLKADLDNWSADVSRITTKADEAAVKVEAGIGAWFLNAKGLLKTGFEDKREFRQKVEPRVPQLIEFINRIIRAIETHPDAGGREVLLILEDLDKPTVDVAMDLFSTKGPILTQPECKIIFTVPTSLLYSGQYNVVKQNFSKQFPLPSFKINEKSGERNERGWAKMREIVERRMERPLIESRALDHAVEMSGGVVRELVRIIQGSASRALVAKANVIKHEHVEQAVDELRTEYSFSLTRDEYVEILRKVHESKELRYRVEEPLLNLLHNLFILEYPNSPGWYEVNPIVHKLIGVGA